MKVFILVKLKFELVAEEDQSNLLKNIVKFKEQKKVRIKTEIFMKVYMVFMKVENISNKSNAR